MVYIGRVGTVWSLNVQMMVDDGLSDRVTEEKERRNDEAALR